MLPGGAWHHSHGITQPDAAVLASQEGAPEPRSSTDRPTHMNKMIYFYISKMHKSSVGSPSWPVERLCTVQDDLTLRCNPDVKKKKHYLI